MLEVADLEGPTDLNDYLLETGVLDRDRYSTIHSYLNDKATPQPWFIPAIIKGLDLDEDQADQLRKVYFDSYF
jgi:hypothetical protein